MSGKQEEIFGLMKVPVEALLKRALVENGKLTAEVDHLTHVIEQKEKEISELKEKNLKYKKQNKLLRKGFPCNEEID